MNNQTFRLSSNLHCTDQGYLGLISSFAFIFFVHVSISWCIDEQTMWLRPSKWIDILWRWWISINLSIPHCYQTKNNTDQYQPNLWTSRIWCIRSALGSNVPTYRTSSNEWYWCIYHSLAKNMPSISLSSH